MLQPYGGLSQTYSIIYFKEFIYMKKYSLNITLTEKSKL